MYEKYKDDFAPAKEKEDVYAHRRQVTLGDYKRKLQGSTIDSLNDEFSEVLKSLHY